MNRLHAGATSLSVAALSAATLAGCAPVLHDADLVPARAARIADAGPTRTDSTYANAVAAIDRRDYARALELLQMARQQSAGDVRVLNAMGVIYDKLGRFDLSGRYYAEAAKADPSSPIVRANIAYSQRLQDGSAGVQVANAPIFKVGPPAQAPTASGILAATPLAQAQAQAPAPVSVGRVAGLSRPRVGPFVPFQSQPDQAVAAVGQGAPPASRGLASIQPGGPLQRIELAALLNVRGVAGLAAIPSPHIAPTATPAAAPDHPRSAEPAASQRPATATTASGPLRQIEPVALIRARAVAGLRRLAELRIELPDWNASITAAPRVTPIVLTTTEAAVNPTVLRRATPVLQPLRIVNATGRLYRAEPIRASLAGLGWSAPRWAMAEARPQIRTVIIYPPGRVSAAKALARTLPGSARLAACASGCTGLRLVLGADVQSWRPMPRPVIRTRSRTA
ncbi:MAG TPA: LytR C-terminal domain-containing protein [Phenylobacterium sp.]|nr:LytR C-terminal domain-containing protein [Phenylobacterium sp.]